MHCIFQGTLKIRGIPFYRGDFKISSIPMQMEMQAVINGKYLSIDQFFSPLSSSFYFMFFFHFFFPLTV